MREMLPSGFVTFGRVQTRHGAIVLSQLELVGAGSAEGFKIRLAAD